MKITEKEVIVNKYMELFKTPAFLHPVTSIEDDNWISVLKKCIEENREWTYKDVGFSDKEIEMINNGEILL